MTNHGHEQTEIRNRKQETKNKKQKTKTKNSTPVGNNGKKHKLEQTSAFEFDGQHKKVISGCMTADCRL